jgi:hypothetical protein
VKNVSYSDSTNSGSFLSFHIDLSLEPASHPGVPKRPKRWQRHSSQNANDTNIPLALPSVQLDSVILDFGFSHSRPFHRKGGDVDADMACIHTCADLASSCLQSLLSSSSGVAKVVRRGDRFAQDLRTALPSVFCRPYTQSISQRSLLVSSISKSLALFRERCPPGTPSMDTQSPAQNTTSSSNVISRGIELQMWQIMLSQTAIPKQVSKLLPSTNGQSKADMSHAGRKGLSPSSGLDDEILQADWDVTEHRNVDFDMSLLARCDNQSLAAKLVTYRESQSTNGADDDAVNHSNTSLKKHPANHMLFDCSDDPWNSYRDATAASSQQTETTSNLCDMTEESWAYERVDQACQDTNFKAKDELIGPCERLTQISGREHPPDDDPLLRSPLSPSGSDVYLEDLHILTSSLENHLGDAVPTLTDSGLLCGFSASDTQNAASYSRPIGDEYDHTLEFSPRITQSPTLDDINDQGDHDLFGSECFNMHMNEADIQSWRSRLSSPAMSIHRNDEQRHDTHRSSASRPGPESHQQSSRSFIKRSSTISTLSSSTSSSPKRHRSLLNRLSRNQSTKSRDNEPDMSDLENQVFVGRDVEVKRRKTLDDYDIEDREDDEMLFV